MECALLGHGLAVFRQCQIFLPFEEIFYCQTSPRERRGRRENPGKKFVYDFSSFLPTYLLYQLINTVILALFAPFCGYAHLIPGSITLLLSSSTSFGSATFCATRMLPVIPRAVPEAVARPTPR
jgi:hypothetical protein